MGFLIDSNIIIYSYSDNYDYLREFVLNEACMFSEISRVEVLGYHKLKVEEENYFTSVFKYVTVILPTQDIFDQALRIRQKYNLKLADSIIAATAYVNGLELYTRNTVDFMRVKGLKCFDPIIR